MTTIQNFPMTPQSTNAGRPIGSPTPNTGIQIQSGDGNSMILGIPSNGLDFQLWYFNGTNTSLGSYILNSGGLQAGNILLATAAVGWTYLIYWSGGQYGSNVTINGNVATFTNSNDSTQMITITLGSTGTR